jgi:hypothetical protein
MRTTLDLEDRLLREATRRATEDGETLTRVIERALRDYLKPEAPHGRPFRLELLIKTGRAVVGVSCDDRDSVYERMEGRG